MPDEMAAGYKQSKSVLLNRAVVAAGVRISTRRCFEQFKAVA
jgi:hypothetical protein